MGTWARRSRPGQDRAGTPSCSRPNPKSARPGRSSSAQLTGTPTGKPRIDSAPGHPGDREVTAMTAIAIDGMGLTGTLRITWVQDNLAHVLDHGQTDETSGTWTGLACPGHGLALGTDVDNTTLQRLAAGSDIADLIWEAPDELTAEHAQVFHAAMRAHHAGDSRRAEQLWEHLQAIWSRAWSA